MTESNGSFRGLYRGITPAVLRSFPGTDDTGEIAFHHLTLTCTQPKHTANAACFLGYEMSMRLLHFLSPSS